MSRLQELAREALEELRRTQFCVQHTASLETGGCDEIDVCTSCEAELYGPNGKTAHLCPRTFLIADLDTALRGDP